METSDKSKVLISVVIPAYNCAATIRVTLDALLSQELNADEIIIVDDFSDIPLSETLGADYPEISIVRHEFNQGVHMARNTGYEMVSGKYVFFLDSDDIICPDFLSVTTDILEKNNEAAACFSFFHTCTAEKSKAFLSAYEGADPDTRLMPRGEGLALYLKKTGMLLPSFGVFRKTALESVKLDGSLFPHDVWGNEDFHLFVRILAKYPIFHVRNKLGVYLVRNDNISSNQANVWLSRGGALDSLIRLETSMPFTNGEVGQLKKMRRVSARRYAKRLLVSGSIKEARIQLQKELRRSPNIKTFGLYLWTSLSMKLHKYFAETV